MYFEFDMMTEKEAENYYYNHYLGDEWQNKRVAFKIRPFNLTSIGYS
jgi:hypothetical protein